MSVHYTKTFAVIQLIFLVKMHPKSQYVDTDKCLILKLTGLMFLKKMFLHYYFMIAMYLTKLPDSLHVDFIEHPHFCSLIFSETQCDTFGSHSSVLCFCIFCTFHSRDVYDALPWCYDSDLTISL